MNAFRNEFAFLLLFSGSSRMGSACAVVSSRGGSRPPCQVRPLPPISGARRHSRSADWSADCWPRCAFAFGVVVVAVAAAGLGNPHCSTPKSANKKN